uniref:Uncharacterized protein n=2 Tax=Clytia hemisphaerica TaxID=252671 RepID=A0A7M5X061_9CNID
MKTKEKSNWTNCFGSIVQVQAQLCHTEISKGIQLFIRISLKKDIEDGMDVNLPVTRLKKTTDSFIQWRDKEYATAWGLNFVSEKDARRFLRLLASQEEKTTPKRKDSDESNSSVGSRSSKRLSSSFGSQQSLDFSNPPSISVTSEEKSEKTPIIRKPLVPPKPKSAHSTSASDIGKLPASSLDIENESEDIPVGYDPVEYDYLMNEKDQESDEFNLGLSASGNKSGSTNSLFLPKEFSADDSLSGISEDFQDTRPPSVVNLTRQMMSTRKAAWLLVKCLLQHSKKGRLEMSNHRKWRKYWVALKGVELLFFQADEKTVTTEDMNEPTFQLDVDSSLVQAVPEYTRLENVFSICTKQGNAYYLQATSQTETENWMHYIHTSAAAAFARKRGLENITPLLLQEIETLQKKLLSEEKLLKMAVLQLKIEKESHIRQNITDQIISWEESLEDIHATNFRLRCYIAAIESTHIPNPQELLTHVSRPTKHALSKLGLFSVTSFISYVNTKNYVCLTTTAASNEKRAKNVRSTKYKSATNGGIKARFLSSLKIADDNVVTAIRNRHSPQTKNRRTRSDRYSSDESNSSHASSRSGARKFGRVGDLLYIQLPDARSCCLPYEPNLKICELMERVCMKENFDSLDYFMMLMMNDNNKHGLLDYTIPKDNVLLDTFNYTRLKLCPKLQYDVTLTNPADYEHGAFGLDMEQTLDERIMVTFVEDGSPARKSGIVVEDEVIEINGQNLRVINNSFNDILEVMNVSSSINLKLRSKRIDDPKKTFQTTESLISFLVCPPPPKSLQPDLSDDLLNTLIVPAPTDLEESTTSSYHSASDKPSLGKEAKVEDIDDFLHQTEQVNMMTREMNSIPIERSTSTAHSRKPGVHLRKAILELRDTEKTYVKNLRILLERYLIPLKEENFLPKDEAELMVNNVREIFDFQSTFFERLKSIIRNDSNFDEFTETKQFQNILYLIGETFLEFVEKFKLYSTFCSCHSRAVKLLELNSNDALRAFLIARNPKQQHTGTVESYLITPIQRILRYPLLMKTMLKLMDKESDEYNCLYNALRKVEEVADYINEMQRISETYTPLFQNLCKQYPEVEKSEMDVDNLLHYGRVHWANADYPNRRNSGHSSTFSSMNNNKTEAENLTVFIFKKAIILISHHIKAHKKLNQSQNMKSDIKFHYFVPISHLILRDHAWSENDSDQVWEIVDATNECEDEQTVFVFVNRTGEEKKVFVNAIKEAKKISKFSNSIPVLGKGTLRSSFDGRRSNGGKEGLAKPTIKKKPSFGKRDTEKKHGIFGK